jgi:hypothetical protein
VSDPLRKRLLERTFKYTKASETDVARTFARIKKQLKEAEAAAAKPVNVKTIHPERIAKGAK